MRSLRTTAVLFIILSLALAACEEATGPTPEGDRVQIEPAPSGETFILKTLETGPPDRRVRLDLLGRSVHVDPNLPRVTVAVAVANRSEHPIHPEVIIWISDLRPDGVSVLNADLVPPATGTTPGDNGPVGFLYGDLLGDDNVLSPGEVSEAKDWQFGVDELRSFSFAAEAEVGSPPDPSHTIAGVVFWDDNANGIQDDDEAPFGAGSVRVDGPGEFVQRVEVQGNGGWGVNTKVAGLYTATYTPPPTLVSPNGFAPIVPTTPNPLEIVLTPGTNGQPVPYHDAHFGYRNAYPEVIPTELGPEDLPRDPLSVENVEVVGHFLQLDAQVSGCGPDHRINVYLSGGFLPTAIPRVVLVISYEDPQEPCDGIFPVKRTYYLGPVMRLFQRTFGLEHGDVALRVLDPQGNQTELFLSF